MQDIKLSTKKDIRVTSDRSLITIYDAQTGIIFGTPTAVHSGHGKAVNHKIREAASDFRKALETNAVREDLITMQKDEFGRYCLFYAGEKVVYISSVLNKLHSGREAEVCDAILSSLGNAQTKDEVTEIMGDIGRVYGLTPDKKRPLQFCLAKAKQIGAAIEDAIHRTTT